MHEYMIIFIKIIMCVHAIRLDVCVLQLAGECQTAAVMICSHQVVQEQKGSFF